MAKKKGTATVNEQNEHKENVQRVEHETDVSVADDTDQTVEEDADVDPEFGPEDESEHPVESAEDADDPETDESLPDIGADAETSETSEAAPSVYVDVFTAAVRTKKTFRKQAANETDGQFFYRLVNTVSSATNEDFDAMSQAARDWFYATAEAINEQREPGVPEGFVSAHSTQATSIQRNPKTPKAAKEPKAPRTPKAKAEKPVKAPKEKPVSTYIREFVVNDTGMGAAKINEQLVELGFKDVKLATVTTLRYDALATLRVAADAGFLVDGFEFKETERNEKPKTTEQPADEHAPSDTENTETPQDNNTETETQEQAAD